MTTYLQKSVTKLILGRVERLALIGVAFALIGAGCAPANRALNQPNVRSAQPTKQAPTTATKNAPKNVTELEKKDDKSSWPSVPRVSSAAYDQCIKDTNLKYEMYVEGQLIVQLSTSTKMDVVVAEFKKLGFDVAPKLGAKYSDLAWFWKPEWGLYSGVGPGNYVEERRALGELIQKENFNVQFAGINDYHDDARKIVNTSMQVGLKKPVLADDFVKEMARYNLVPLQIEEPVDLGFEVLNIKKGEEAAWKCYLTKVRPELVQGVFLNHITQLN